MDFFEILSNPVLIVGFAAWGLAQLIKVPWGYFSSGRWDWVLLLRAGGMPSSHSALVAGVAHAIGLFEGFASPIFALALTLAVIVIYDATGIRRQAGMHAEFINRIIQDRLKGKVSSDRQLREVLGHTPMEALAGTILGIAVAQIVWLLW
ncbi:MAG: divergent PAP2 family protein [Anaerolineales bacterium]